MDDEFGTLKLRPGERAEVRLPGLGTAGYRWTARVEGDPDVVDVSVVTAPAEEVAGQPPGVSVDEVATLEALRPGQATVYLELRRSWENKPRSQDERVIEVVVS